MRESLPQKGQRFAARIPEERIVTAITLSVSSGSVAFWWVNQGQTWRYEVDGGFMWAPKTNANGRRSTFYDNMLRVEVGDVVFSYFRGAISAVGVAVASASSSPKPEFGSAGTYWSDDGWEVLVDFEYLDSGVDPRLLLDLYNADQRAHGPMNEAGRVNQSYLFELSPAFGSRLLQECQNRAGTTLGCSDHDREWDDVLKGAEELLGEENMTRTERRQLALSRVGQGIFRRRVAEREPLCRVTGLAVQQHLIASHMKPWRDGSSLERLDGANGLLLSPHVDHLFDRGLVTFTNAGAIVFASAVDVEVVNKWHLGSLAVTRPFSAEQRPYLEYHRDLVFQG